MRNLLFVILILSVALTAKAQSEQSRIVDQDGNGIAGVEVLGLTSCQGRFGPGVSTITDANGFFNWPIGQWPPPIPGSSGSSCAATTSFQYNIRKAGYSFHQTYFVYTPTSAISLRATDSRLPVIHGTTLPTWACASAASFGMDAIASEMLIAAFGENLATTTTAAATTPLPTTLAGRRVIVRDARGVEKAASLLFVSPTQVNFVAPADLAEGSTVVKLIDENGSTVKVGLMASRKVVPGIFTANANATGVPAGLIVRVKPGNVQNYEPLAQINEQQGHFIPLSIDLGPEDEFLVLALFGTGWRKVGSLANVRVRVGGIDCPVEYAGSQLIFEGVDQINARLPRSLIGKGEVDVVVSFSSSLPVIGDDGFRPANTVRLKFK